MNLHIAHNLHLPIEAVTQTFAFLGKRGGGKTYAAMKLAELMLDANAQIIAFDPVGKWYGLRMTGEGEGAKGYGIPVFGGLFGDLPLQPHAGALIADLIVERNLSAVLDVSQFILSEQTRFMLDFIQAFFQRKKSQSSPIHLFVEECQEFIPQNLPKGEGRGAHLLHHFERTIKLGRNFGIGASLISQRPQEVNKKVLNQTEVLFVFQMTGIQERKTIEEWTRTKGIDNDLKAELPTLSQGQAHVWSPSWLFVNGLYKVSPKRSADVSATPTVESVTVKTKPLTKVDVVNLKEAMQTIVKESEKKDPTKLQTKIYELEKQLKHAQSKVETKTVEVPILTKEDISALRVVTNELFSFSERLAIAANAITAALDKFSLSHVIRRSPQPVPIAQPVQEVKKSIVSGNGSLSGGERKILSALSQYPNGKTKTQIAILTGYSHKGGAFNNYLGSLNSKGYINRNGSFIAITDEGLATGVYEPLPTGQALIDYWMSQLGKAERSILQTLIDVYPAPLSKEEVATLTGYEARGGGFNNAVGKLRTLELIQGKGMLCAANTFFE